MDLKVDEILKKVVEIGAADLYIIPGSPLRVNLEGRLQDLYPHSLTPEDTAQLIRQLLSDEAWAAVLKNRELNVAYSLHEVARFRVNVYFQRGTMAAVIRQIKVKIPGFEELNLPPLLGKLILSPRGLILVTGATGTGKSTTMAAMIDQINRERRCVIVTIEDPIEYLHRPISSIVKQREVFSDTKSFANALRHVLRQDPNVICIGEMRDLETIQTALTAAETGHLVIATLHTPDAVQTVDRIIDVFPPHHQQQVRIQLANTLQGIVAQQLLPIAGGGGRVPAVEILVATIAVRKIIRSAKTEQLTTLIQTSYDQGMITMDKSLKELYLKGLITYDSAINKCKYPEAFDSL
ncbi:MAG: type IV pilus twitching motility protein PilT [Candidatus Sumerlaeia bacterium]|nr:type IV pilus twitching motility protein PilT [Candidatus Sumerlaeia bacterium]